MLGLTTLSHKWDYNETVKNERRIRTPLFSGTAQKESYWP